MDQETTHRLPYWIGLIASLLTGVLGIAFLLGHAFGVDLLRMWQPAWPTMVPLTALCFVVTATAITLQLNSTQLTRTPNLRYLALACATLPALIGLIRVSVDWIGIDIGWDQLWFALPVQHANHAAPAAMSPATALSFVLFGGALLLSARSHWAGLSQLIAIVPLPFAWMGLSHHIYGGDVSHFFSAMSAPTALAVALLCPAVFLVHPDRGIARWVRGEQPSVSARVGISPNVLFSIGITLSFIASLAIFIYISYRELQQLEYVLDAAKQVILEHAEYSGYSVDTEHLAALTKEAATTREIAANSTGLGAALLIVVYVLLRRENRLRHKAQSIMQQTNADLELRVQQRTAELTRTNEMLKVSESLFRSVVTSTNQCVWTVRRDGQATAEIEREAAAWWCTMAGQTEAERQGSDGFGWLSVVHEQDRDAMRNFWMSLQQSTEQVLIEFRVINRVQGLRWILTHSVPLRNAENEVIAWIGTTSDITKRKVAEISLQESEDRFRQAFENGPMGIAIRSAIDGKFSHVNKAFCNMLEYSEEEMLQLSASDITYPEDRDQDQEILLQLQEHRIQSHVTEKRYITKHRKTVWGIRALAGFRTVEGEMVSVIAMIQDITANKRGELERLALEDQLRQSQKMEAIGTLAGGIAHDFNNILTGIMGFTALAQQSLDNTTQLSECLGQINLAGQRAANLVQQILAFSRVQDQQRIPLQWRHVIAESAKLLRAAIPSSIEIETTLLSPLPPVVGNATQLHQVMMNLGANAAYAMRDNPGMLSISLDSIDIIESLANQMSDTPPGSYVRLTVSDTGCGIDEVNLKRIFDPFFTTKPPGEGTGLGLSVVHGIIRSHRGTVRVTSKPGRGTTIEILLPAYLHEATDDALIVQSLPRGNGERVLFVDDEEMLTQLGEHMLGQLGYIADTDSEVLKALARIKREPDLYRLIISDQTMPAMTGLEFAARVHEIRPNLPVLLTSGFSQALNSERIMAAGVTEVLPKPYTIETLAAAVHRQLTAN